MLKFIALILFLLALLGGYFVYKYISEKKDSLMNTEKLVDDNIKKPLEKPMEEVPTPKIKDPTPATPLTTDESVIIANLTSIANAQNNWENEFGSYAHSLKKLEKSKKTTPKLKKLFEAINEGKEYDGYIFTELVDDKESDDTRAHYGFFATPAPNHKGKSLLLLMDLNEIEAYEGQTAEEQGSIKFYDTTEEIAGIKSWPTTIDTKKWKLIKIKSTPKEPKKEPKKFDFNNNEDN